MKQGVIVTANRTLLHDLVDQLPEGQLHQAHTMLEALASDDELTLDEAVAVLHAQADPAPAMSHDEMKRLFGL